MTSNRTGLISLDDIKAVLGKESTNQEFHALHLDLVESEPVLGHNLEHWVQQEINTLLAVFPDLDERVIKHVKHLLSRYFIRGFNMCRQANNVFLENWYKCNEGGPNVAPPDHK